MGCTSSVQTRASGTAPAQAAQKDQQSAANGVDQPPENGDLDPEFIQLDEARAMVMKELDMDDEKAQRLAKTININGQINTAELNDLNAQIRATKDSMEPKFRAYDPDGSGFVSREDAVNILSEELCGLPHGSIVSMVARYDTNNTNAVDYVAIVEFYALVKAKKSQLERKFDELDRDASGDLAADELLQVMVEESSLPEFQVASIIDDFDLNKDGRIDREEFMYMWTKLFERID